MKTLTPPCPTSIPRVNSAASSRRQNSASGSAFLCHVRRTARRISYTAPSAKPVIADAVSCISWSDTARCIYPKSLRHRPPAGALSS